MKKDWMWTRAAALLAVVATSGFLPAIAAAQAPAARPAAAPAASPVASRATDAAEAMSSAVEATAAAAGAAVVQIFTMSYAPTEGAAAGTAELVRTQRASGSGAIVDASGYIVTNAHVVRGAQRIRVEVPTVPTGGSILAARGKLFDGKVVGLDSETDLAVVKIEADNLPTLKWAEYDKLQVGDLVLAEVGGILKGSIRGSDFGTSGSLQLSDTVTTAITTGIGGVLIAAAAGGLFGYTTAFTVLFVLMAAVAVSGLVLARQARPPT